MLAILERAFGDPDPIGIATRALRNLKQRNTVSTYVAEFSRLAAEVAWNDQAKLNQFNKGLSYELEQALIYFPKVNTLNDLTYRPSQTVEQKNGHASDTKGPYTQPRPQPAPHNHKPLPPSLLILHLPTSPPTPRLWREEPHPSVFRKTSPHSGGAGTPPNQWALHCLQKK